MDLALSIEAKFPTGLRRLFIREEYTVVPNRNLSIREKLLNTAFGVGNRYDSSENISNALHPKKVRPELLLTFFPPLHCPCCISDIHLQTQAVNVSILTHLCLTTEFNYAGAVPE